MTLYEPNVMEPKQQYREKLPPMATPKRHATGIDISPEAPLIALRLAVAAGNS